MRIFQCNAPNPETFGIGHPHQVYHTGWSHQWSSDASACTRKNLEKFVFHRFISSDMVVLTIHTPYIHYQSLPYNTLPYNTLPYNTLLLYVTLLYIAIQYISIHCSTIQHIAIQYIAIQYIINALPYNKLPFNIWPYNTLQCITLHLHSHLDLRWRLRLHFHLYVFYITLHIFLGGGAWRGTFGSIRRARAFFLFFKITSWSRHTWPAQGSSNGITSIQLTWHG